MKTSIMLFSFILLTSCYNWERMGNHSPHPPRLQVVRGSGVMYNKYVQQKLDQCKIEVANLVIRAFEQHAVTTTEQVKHLEASLMSQCANYYKISV